MRRWLVVLVLVVACGGDAAGVATTTTAAPEQTAAPELVVPRQLEGLEVVTLDIGGRPHVVAVARTATHRSTGLMFITDLDDLDGMVFVYRSDTATTFHMENTLIPLDIAFFASDGTFVSKATMTPCISDECPDYESGGRYRYAIEVPAGDFDWVGPDTVLNVTPLSS
jgi:uncharacterized membrane protein (UPF0127 family)